MIGGQGEEDAWVIDSARARRATMMAECTLLGMMRGCADNHPSEGARVGAGTAHAGARAGAQAEWARGAEPGRRLATVHAAHGPWSGLGMRAPCTGSDLVVCNGLPPKTALGVLALARLHLTILVCIIILQPVYLTTKLIGGRDNQFPGFLCPACFFMFG